MPETMQEILASARSLPPAPREEVDGDWIEPKDAFPAVLLQGDHRPCRHILLNP